ncbi:MAG: right-handed parallel beta-helix repeat-containing protein, partial [bacterium]
RRHAILVRAPGGLIEGNTIDGVGGSGVYMSNEFGSFYEGPVPQDCTIRSNLVRNTQGVPIVVGSKRATTPAVYVKNILITGNRIEASSTPCIQAYSVNGLAISNNILSAKSKGSSNIEPLSLTNIVSGTIFSNLVE